MKYHCATHCCEREKLNFFTLVRLTNEIDGSYYLSYLRDTAIIPVRPELGKQKGRV